MAAIIIKGNELAKQIKAEIKEEVDSILSSGGRRPHLAAVLVGDNAASMSYIRNKVRSCEQCGFQSTLIHPPASTRQAELLEIVKGLNEDDGVDGFIVQLPLPSHIQEEAITLAIDHKKDVDGFHPTNFGRMALGLPAYLPATPNGILEMLQRYGIPTAGKHCVVLGRSHIVGSPMSILLAQKSDPGNCTVTLTHSRTQDIASETRRADIIIVALGQAGFLTSDMVKDGVVIIDVGINRVEDASAKNGYRLKGDADFEALLDKASFITPVPGGVGPMTVASLLMNTLKAYKGEVY